MITKVDVTENGVTTYNCQTNNDVNELKTSDKYKYCTASSMAYFRDGNNLITIEQKRGNYKIVSTRAV